MREIQFYDMTEFSDSVRKTHGDCFRACVKTLFQIHDDLPHSIGYNGHWNGAFLLELDQRKLTASAKRWNENEDHTNLSRILIVSGPTTRTPETGGNHAILWDRVANQMIHDPHPSRKGVLSIEWFYCFGELE